MTVTQKIPWLRIGAESAAIVGSILLAFGVDAWWAERLDRRAEGEELNRLHEEFAEVHSLLNGEQTETQERTHAAMAELLRMVQGHADRDQPLEVSNALLRRAIVTASIDFATPVLDGLVLSGRLSIFQSEGVPAAIAGWQGAISEVSEIELSTRELGITQLIPALIVRGNMGAVLTGTSTDGRTLLSVDDELEGLLGWRFQATQRVLSRLDSLKASLDEVLSAIEQSQEISTGTE